jgi:hypothetical protein
VSAHGDNPVGAELLSGEDGEQPDGAVTDDGDGLAGPGLGGDGAEPAGTEDVGGGEEARDQVTGRNVGGGDQRAVSQRDPQPLRLGAFGSDACAVDARRLVAGPTDLAGVVGGEKRTDHELARLDRRYLGADLLDDPGVLMTHWRRPAEWVRASVRPEVRAADTSGGQPDDRVGRRHDLRFGALLDPNVTGAYMTAPRTIVSSSAWRCIRLDHRIRPRTAGAGH